MHINTESKPADCKRVLGALMNPCLPSRRLVHTASTPGLSNRGCGPTSGVVCLTAEEHVVFPGADEQKNYLKNIKDACGVASPQPLHICPLKACGHFCCILSLLVGATSCTARSSQ